MQKNVSMYIACAVLLSLVVCLTVLASFFPPSHLSLKHVHVWVVSVQVLGHITLFVVPDYFSAL